MMEYVLFLCVFLCTAACSVMQNAFRPLQLAAVIAKSANGTCPSAAMRGEIHRDIQDQVESLLRDEVIPSLRSRPPCACGGPGEWTRIAHLNMSDPSQQCPSNWTLITTPVRGCGRSSSGCNSAIFPSQGQSYSRVCGRVIAYQSGSTDGFRDAVLQPTLNGLEEDYIDGVSLTYGAAGSRQHVWSFVTAYSENDPFSRSYLICACTNISQSWPYQVPSFVGENYFCETGNPGPGSSFTTVYADDPLWDGEGCGPSSSCCEFNNPPWFCTALPKPTTDDIELRICGDLERNMDEDTIISLVDIHTM